MLSLLENDFLNIKWIYHLKTARYVVEEAKYPFQGSHLFFS